MLDDLRNTFIIVIYFLNMKILKEYFDETIKFSIMLRVFFFKVFFSVCDVAVSTTNYSLIGKLLGFSTEKIFIHQFHSQEELSGS